MLFNSFEFAVFLPTVLFLYWVLPHRAQNRMLLVASYFFYGWWDWRFLALIAISTVVDFICARRIYQYRESASGVMPPIARRWLSLSIATNLSILGFFKYFDFFAASFADLAYEVGFSVEPLFLEIILPVGISFYTFQTMSYSIDVYRGQMKPTNRFFDFALFVAFFPQLVAGPIERARRLLPRILNKREFELSVFLSGVNLIAIGLFKKVFIADNLAPIVDGVFGADSPGAAAVMVGAYAFALQIYCDFSGYSDVARGCGRCMGIELMKNFDHPYVSANPSEFWRRWHISLSTWLRDYLYIPLGGNRKGNVRTYANLSTTMLLGGLWHGASWVFVLWGAYQGLLLVIHRLYTRSTFYLARKREQNGLTFSRVIKAIVFFQLVCVGWVIFRAQSVAQVADMLAAVMTLRDLAWPEEASKLALFALALIVLELSQLPAMRAYVGRLGWRGDLLRAGGYAGVLYLVMFYGSSTQSFIYFQF